MPESVNNHPGLKCQPSSRPRKGKSGPVWFRAFPSHFSAGDKELELFLAHGASLEGKNVRGEGPAGAAALAEDWAGLRRILELGAKGKGDLVAGEPIETYLEKSLENERILKKDTRDLERALALIRK